jgi:hypothetical protein
MDNFWLVLVATVIEGICAVKIARKFKDLSPSWKFFIPIYNIFVYGKFSLLSPQYLFTLALIQAIDIIFSFVKDVHPLISSSQVMISIASFLIWAVMVARIAVRLGQGFWSYLAATVCSAVASNFTVVALLYMFIPTFSFETASIPLWAEVVAVFIISLPFISLAFDNKAQY